MAKAAPDTKREKALVTIYESMSPTHLVRRYLES